MRRVEINAEIDYGVVIDCNWQSELLEICSQRTRTVIIHTQEMAERVQIAHGFEGEIFYYTVANGEEAKSFASISKLWSWLGEHGFTRTDLIVGVGGGAVTDLAGFAAASWLRGVDWVGVPTSMAGMVDASIGGKTGINSEYGKNLIGAFHSPLCVLIDISWLDTLSDRDFSAGMAEVIKCGFIADRNILQMLEGFSLATLRGDTPRVVSLIELAVGVKAKVVTSDFKESFAREILNYGHTLAHAIETHSAYALRHGEAVSIGLVFAAELAQIKGLLASEIVDQHRELLTAMNLPVTYPRWAWGEILALLALDKKSRGTRLRFVAISNLATTLRIEDANERELISAYERVSL